MPKQPSRKTADLELAIAESALEQRTGCVSHAEGTSTSWTHFKAGALAGGARIGRVTFSKTGRTLYYNGRTFSLKGAAFKSNYYCVETGEDYWISGPKRRGGDALYGGG